jgi:quercetin dioxygenase-like cupin family protein/transcriptional regulator with XRE-family HTH domain
VNPNDDLKEFLTTRRAKLTPDQAGLPVYGDNRRVAGLRREEVAVLAGISVEYYTRLERGNVGSVSESVLEGVAHALQLDEAERDHLHRLVHAAATKRPARRNPTRKRVRPTIQRMLDLMPTPAYLRNGRFDVLAANDLGRALYSPLYEQSEQPNSARFLFLDPASSEFFVDFDKVQGDCVAFLRTEAGRDPYDKDLQDLIGELSTRSERFRRLWAGPRPAGQLDPPGAHHHREGSNVKLLPTRPTAKGPAGLFTGDVHFDVIARGEDTSRIRVNTVRFAPCARTAWHSHSLGQTLHVTEGIGVVATRDEVLIMRPGDTVHTPPGEEHWHGALPDHFMSHLAIWEDDDATWGDHVTDQEFDRATRA